MDVVIACGKAVNMEQFGNIPKNVGIYPHVNQLEVLAEANVFLTHCGMNSVSEGLYMAAPLILFPQTKEQRAVARRAFEMGAGIYLKDGSAQAVKTAVHTILGDQTYVAKAMECSRDFREAPGPKGAAEFIETAPHVSK